MSQGPLCPNLSQKVQKEVFQMANRNLSCVILLGGLSVNLNHLKITPGMDPYAQLDLEEEELEYKVGDETASEIHPDDADADDLSCITIDSLKHIDNDKVKEIWAGMAKLKHQEGEYYEQLAGMVDEMTPEVIYQSVQATPRPSTNVPTCADELLEELGSAELF